MAEKGNVSALGLPARSETMPGIFSSGNRPRTAREGAPTVSVDPCKRIARALSQLRGRQCLHR